MSILERIREEKRIEENKELERLNKLQEELLSIKRGQHILQESGLESTMVVISQELKESEIEKILYGPFKQLKSSFREQAIWEIYENVLEDSQTEAIPVCDFCNSDRFNPAGVELILRWGPYYTSHSAWDFTGVYIHKKMIKIRTYPKETILIRGKRQFFLSKEQWSDKSILETTLDKAYRKPAIFIRELYTAQATGKIVEIFEGLLPSSFEDYPEDLKRLLNKKINKEIKEKLRKERNNIHNTLEVL